ncbi:hypothetical protein [Kitasatospora griseola]|uniref:hypothetical protein n=1 Tax=Kitasatospora griseola TaxID=2064 RepID=UPI0034470DD9
MSSAMQDDRPGPPIGEAAPARMDDDALAAELQALHDYQRGEAADGRRIGMPVLSQIGNRRGSLTHEQTQRRHRREKAERAAAEREQRAARQARTRIGRPGPDGRSPVAVDGQHAGWVWRARRDWFSQAEGGQSTLLGTRWEAADAIVQTVDARAAREAEQRRRAEPPAGWLAAEEGEVFEVLDVVRLAGPRYGPAWGRPQRVTRREEHQGGRVSFRLEPADEDGPWEGLVLFADRLGPFVRPTAAVLAGLPPVPFRVLHPEEHEARRLLNVSDELSCLGRVEGCANFSRRALELLAGVEAGRSTDPAADMATIAGLAEELLGVVSDMAHPEFWSRQYDRSSAQHAVRWAAWAAERFAGGGGALTEEYRKVLQHPH